jgi:hypothetical protein
MPFEYFNPCADLSRYIHSYWTFKSGEEMYDVVYPDACVDILVNMGEQFETNQNNLVLEAQSVYLGGALTEAMCQKIPEWERLPIYWATKTRLILEKSSKNIRDFLLSNTKIVLKAEKLPKKAKNHPNTTPGREANFVLSLQRYKQ